MSLLIESDKPGYVLGVNSMDKTHFEFIDLVNQLGAAESKALFSDLFLQLFTHTEAHFAAENQLMIDTAFPALQEHRAEHSRILGALNRLANKLPNSSTILARSYVNNYLPDWFNLHAATMDSALAAHIKAQVKAQGVTST